MVRRRTLTPVFAGSNPARAVVIHGWQKKNPSHDLDTLADEKWKGPDILNAFIGAEQE